MTPHEEAIEIVDGAMFTISMDAEQVVRIARRVPEEQVAVCLREIADTLSKRVMDRG